MGNRNWVLPWRMITNAVLLIGFIGPWLRACDTTLYGPQVLFYSIPILPFTLPLVVFGFGALLYGLLNFIAASTGGWSVPRSTLFVVTAAWLSGVAFTVFLLLDKNTTENPFLFGYWLVLASLTSALLGEWYLYLNPYRPKGPDP